MGTQGDEGRLKCVLVGDLAVGKTCMALSYLDDKFAKNYLPTICDNYSKQIVVDDQTYEISVWDTAGQEEFEQLRALSYPNTSIFIICYSVVDPESFVSVEEKWVPEIKRNCPTTPFIVVGTKMDLRDDEECLSSLADKDQKPITTSEGQSITDDVGGAAYVECSAYKRINLPEVFAEAVRHAAVAQKKGRKGTSAKGGGKKKEKGTPPTSPRKKTTPADNNTDSLEKGKKGRTCIVC
mmetsp:Transcript_46079/g.116032  ORF Transcript_46079/g.116032 Transcript_46079/m.116032 type:complete len:238 (+) Transcript_46079:188-901(+)|eukprot:CAMPEP_0177649890 /NCGR_PEP_ID=MMETSP0447-20121125/11638_1 /TAXON_ID=0 /ORGANISM="Stygamoeba regulata, Strain BSH-02190019" /LENGTH=237 /DNA_ID=CAMNT_0019152699 /DNA_START=128 /DNA_END=841 /DNA_ORIENTATION=+